MFVQPILLIFCMVWGIVHFSRRATSRRASRESSISDSVVYFCILAVHWYVMGIMMTGELPRLSNRAKRRLPQSFLGRVFLTWFNPGPGTGYLFAISNLAGSIVDRFRGRCLPRILLHCRSTSMRFRSAAAYPNWRSCVSLIFGYVALYLGFGRLLISLLRRVASVGIVLAVLLQALWVLLGCLVPQLIEMMQRPHIHIYTLLYVFDPFSTLLNADKLRLGYMTPVLTIVLVRRWRCLSRTCRASCGKCGKRESPSRRAWRKKMRRCWPFRRRRRRAVRGTEAGYF